MDKDKPREAILLHNAGGCPLFLNPQYKILSKQGIKKICPDLPGHGENTGKLKTSIEEIAANIWSEADEHGLAFPSIIGLNYGACVGIEMGYQQPDRVSALVLLDPPLLMESWVVKLVQDHIQELYDEGFVNFAEHLVRNVMKKGCDEDKKMAISSFQKIKRMTLAKVYEGLLHWDKSAKEKLSHCSIPLLHIQSENPFCQEDPLGKICPQAKHVQIKGTGPWLSLEKPERVNQEIIQFLGIK